VVGSQSNWEAFVMSELDATETGLETALLQAEMVRGEDALSQQVEQCQIAIAECGP
jgi:hypothetical protein